MGRQKIDFLRNKDVVMVNCAVICRTEEIAEYIRKRCNNFALINFAPYNLRNIASVCSFYKKNRIQKEFKLLTIRESFILRGFLLFLLTYLNYIFSVFYSFIRIKKRFDIYIGVGHFYTFIGLIIKKLGICKKVVYYSGDYFEADKRSDYKRKVFQLFDKINIRYVDAIRSGSQAMIDARQKAKVFTKEGIPNFATPFGLNINERCLENNLFNTNEIIFLGNIQAGRGLELLLDVFPNLIKSVPDIRLHIVGTGNYEKFFKEQVSKRKMDDYISFHGFVGSKQLLDEIFSRCVVGLALYLPEDDNFTKYVTPGKIMEYLSRGLPIITTDVSSIAEKIREYGAGAIIDYSSSELEQTILKMLKDRRFLKRCSASAKRLALQYRWNKILDRAFEKIFTGWQKMDKTGKIILNLGCGQTCIEEAINVDFIESPYCDKIVDLSKFPYPWEDNSIDEIYMLHIIEHFDSDIMIKVFKEVHRILKVNGLLHIQCPHFSSMLSLTCPDHKKAFSITTFSFLEGNNYIIPEPLFKTELTKINFLMQLHSENKYVDFDLQKTNFDRGKHPLMRKLLLPVRVSIQFLIDLSPFLFERCWRYWVGGADEVIYRGRKV